MNANEFDQWLAYHTTAFPSLSDWLAQDAPNRQTLWGRNMVNARLDDAKAATDAMLRGDMDEPKGWSKHPAAILAYCRERARSRPRPSGPKAYRQADGSYEFAYRCLLCEDVGVRFVWHDRSVQAMQEGRFGEARTRYSMVVRCQCEAGFPRLPKFDDQRHVPLEKSVSCPEDIERLREFASRPEEKPENYVEAFDQWNHG